MIVADWSRQERDPVSQKPSEGKLLALLDRVLVVGDYLSLSEYQGSLQANLPTTAGRLPTSAQAPVLASSLKHQQYML